MTKTLFFLVSVCIIFYNFIFTMNRDRKDKIKIAFIIKELSHRAIEVSTFDYAHFNETLLGNESIIINFDVHTDNDVRKKFAMRFPGKFFDCTLYEEMDYILEQEQVDILYFQKPGHDDSIVSKICKNAVHAVFPQAIQLHGDVYAFVSEWFVVQFPNLNVSYVPYIVRVEETDKNLRKELGISDDAIVFGRYGGFESFNIPFVKEVIKEIVASHTKIYFIFLNTQQFCNLPNVIFLPKTADMLYKAKFINTCDAMIHAHWRGETFGLACAEFSIKNKPVITWSESKERAHINMLGNVGIYYRTKEDLTLILSSFKKELGKKWNVCSNKFSPEIVMKKFQQIFITPLLQDHNKKDKMTKQLLFKATRGAGGLNEEFILHIQQIFDIDVFIKEGSDGWYAMDHIQKIFKKIYITEIDPSIQKQACERFRENDNIHICDKTLLALAENKNIFLDKEKIVIFFDCYWRENMQKKSYVVSSIREDLESLDRVFADHLMIIVDGIHCLDQISFEILYHALLEKNYQFFISNNTVIAFHEKDILVDPLIKAMTVSRMYELEYFARDKKLNDLLAAEQVIGHFLAEIPTSVEFNKYSPIPSFGSRYHQLWKGLSALHRGDYQEAAFQFKKIISQGYQHWRLYWYLAQAWYKIGNIEAENAVQKVLSENKNFFGIANFRNAISS